MLLREKIGLILLMGTLTGAVSFFGLMVLTPPFQSSMDFLVVQTNGQNQDFYTQFKSSEYLGKVLSEAVYSERFIEAVVETGKVNAEFLPFDKKARLKAWSRMVSVRKNLELGMLSVVVTNERERDAARVMKGIAEVLTEKNALFRGGDEKSVEIRVLSGPISERNPNTSMIVKTVTAGFLAGFFLASFAVIIRGEARYRRRAALQNLDLDNMPV